MASSRGNPWLTRLAANITAMSTAVLALGPLACNPSTGLAGLRAIPSG